MNEKERNVWSNLHLESVQRTRIADEGGKTFSRRGFRGRDVTTTVRRPVFLGTDVGRVHSAVPTDYVIVPLGRRMHYEITGDKSVLHSRGQPTAFMNENLYCSPANRSRSTPRRPRTENAVQ